jgi:uncharacterized protein YdhG (YjbR/CyaY superfamily)
MTITLNQTIDGYIAFFPKDVQQKLQKIRKIIHDAVPEATETIRYAMPTFQLLKQNMVHFAGYTHHIGFYPTPGPIKAFANELTGYKQSKGAIQFPLDKVIPYELIKKIVTYRAKTMKENILYTVSVKKSKLYSAAS